MNGKDIFLGLKYIGEDLIENAETGEFPTQKKSPAIYARPEEHIAGKYAEKRRKTKLGRPFQVAAVIVLMLVMTGCAATVLLKLDKLRVSEEDYVSKMHYSQDGTKILPTEKTRQYISIVGVENSNTQLALREWMDFQKTYDPDGTKRQGAESFEVPEQYQSYHPYTQEMIEKLDEIFEKYDLLPEGPMTIIQQDNTAMFTQIVGVDSLGKKGAELNLEFQGTTINACGNFTANCHATMKSADKDEEFMFALTYSYHDKAYFGTQAYFVIEDSNAVDQWNYTLPDGENVLIVMEQDEDAYILYDRGDAFIAITVANVGWDWDSPSQVMSHKDMEQIAQGIDFSPKPQPIEDFGSLQAKLEADAQARENETWDPEEQAEAERIYQENEVHDSYGELIAYIRDNEAYFTERKSDGYKNFWETMEYTLRDVTGDGEDELIFGKDGHMESIWTMVDGKTRPIRGYREGHLCEGNVEEDYAVVGGKPYHWYHRLTSDGRGAQIMCVAYDSHNECWVVTDYENGSDPKNITEEEAMEIIASFVRIPLEMKSVKEFPME